MARFQSQEKEVTVNNTTCRKSSTFKRSSNLGVWKSQVTSNLIRSQNQLEALTPRLKLKMVNLELRLRSLCLKLSIQRFGANAQACNRHFEALAARLKLRMIKWRLRLRGLILKCLTYSLKLGLQGSTFLSSSWGFVSKASAWNCSLRPLSTRLKLVMINLRHELQGLSLKWSV